MAKKVFFSFHFKNDCMRTQQVRNMGALEGNQPVTAQKWEEVKGQGDAAVEKWIEDNMKGKSCVVVLIGEETSKRPWVKHEIIKAWKDGKGVLGIYIHNLKCPNNGTCSQGANPFDGITMTNEKKMSAYVQCYNPKASDAYNDIAGNIESWIDAAVKARQ